MKTFEEWKKERSEAEVSDSLTVLILLSIIILVAALAA
jgi:hypothetical protein